MNLIQNSIKLTLSSHCSNLIDSDADVFNVSFSKIIECIILAYCKDSAIASEEEGNLSKMLANDTIKFKKSIVYLIDSKSDKRPYRTYINGAERKTWSVTNEARKALKKDSRTDDEWPGFINRLIEEYAIMPFSLREQILLHEQIEEIQHAIDEKRPFRYVSGGGDACVMHPVEIAVDPMLQYNYVIGFGVREKYYHESFEPEEKYIRNIRIFNIKRILKHSWIDILMKEKLKINKDLIEKRKTEISPGFISELPVEVKVWLNEKGESRYRSIIHNRPMRIGEPVKIEGGYREYTFRTTAFQAVIYFLNFDDTARIVSPPEIVDSLKERLKITLKMYE